MWDYSNTAEPPSSKTSELNCYDFIWIELFLFNFFLATETIRTTQGILSGTSANAANVSTKLYYKGDTAGAVLQVLDAERRVSDGK
jgi:hypothetical protein